MRKLIRLIKKNPRYKHWALNLLFRPRPYSSKLRAWAWLIFILPKYFKKGVSWRCRLDLAPFHKFTIGQQCRIEQGVVINNGMGDVIFGDEVHTGIGCIISGPVILQKHVGLAQYVRVIGMHHGIDIYTPHHYQAVSKAPIIMEEDVFVGTGAVIMGKSNGEPLTLGKYCRIGANAVVKTDIPPYSIAVGNPARVVKIWDFECERWIKPISQQVS